MRRERGGVSARGGANVICVPCKEGEGRRWVTHDRDVSDE